MPGVSYQSPVDESTILKPYRHLYSNSKEPQMLGLIQAMNQLIKAPQEGVEVTCEVMCIVERSLCITDDLFDNSKLRGNVATAHEVFGLPHSLAASWYSMYTAFERLFALKKPKAVEMLIKNMKVILEGQTMEFLWRDSFQCPTEEEALQKTIKKSGHWICMYTELLQEFAQDERDLTKLSKLMGRYFEAVDDMDDIQPRQTGGYSEDINEGKFGLPLVIAINRHPDKLDKGEIAVRMADEASRGPYIESLLKESSALVCCREIINELEAEIRRELNALGGSAIADSLLNVRFDP